MTWIALQKVGIFFVSMPCNLNEYLSRIEAIAENKLAKCVFS